MHLMLNLILLTLDKVVYTDINGAVVAEGSSAAAYKWEYFYNAGTVTESTGVGTPGGQVSFPDHSLVMLPLPSNGVDQEPTHNCFGAGTNGGENTTAIAKTYLLYENVDLDGNGTIEPVLQYADPAVINYSRTVLPVSISFVSSELPVSGNTAINWSTTQHSNTLGFMLYQRTETGWTTLGDGELIAVEDYDTFETQNYVSQVTNLEGEWFAIADVDTSEKVTLHGPYKVGTTYGKSEADIKVEAVDWSLISIDTQLDVNAIQNRIKRLKGGQ